MPINRLAITHFRNIQQADIVFSPQLNLIYGANGSGKTSLLEAIHYLSTARSFRTHNARGLIQHRSSSLVLFGEVSLGPDHHLPIGIQRSGSRTTVRISGTDASSLTELLGLLPLQFLGPETLRVLESGPSYRRRILDWGVFHVEHSFFRTWYRYERIVQQRNALLRRKQPNNELASWDLELVRLGELLTSQRAKYLEVFLPQLQHCLDNLLPSLSEGVNAYFDPGWSDKFSLHDALINAREADIRHGHTSVGPHRADLQFTIGKHQAKDVLSRGQQKMLVAAFRLAQASYHNSLNPDRPCLVMYDDLLSELDSNNAARLLSYTLQSGCQLFITTLRDSFEQQFRSLVSSCESKVFHVEQGTINAR